MSGIPRKLVFSVLVTGFMLGGLEAVARVLLSALPELPKEFFLQDFEDPRHLRDPILFWRLRPGLRKTAQDGGVTYRWEVNEQGFRAPGPVSLRKAAGTRRVICIGDSVTFGWEVEGEDAYPALLAGRLARREGPVEVINAGVPGYSSYQGRFYLERELLAYSPDVVITYLGINDCNASVVSDRVRGTLLAWQQPLEHLSSFRLLQGLLHKWTRGSLHGSERGGSLQAKRVRLEEFVETMEAIGSLCSQRKIKLVVVQPVVLSDGHFEPAWPDAAQVEHDLELKERFRVGAARHDAPDLTAVLRPYESEAASLLVPDDPCHFNRKGHELVATAIAKAVDRR